MVFAPYCKKKGIACIRDVHSRSDLAGQYSHSMSFASPSSTNSVNAESHSNSDLGDTVGSAFQKKFRITSATTQNFS